MVNISRAARKRVVSSRLPDELLLHVLSKLPAKSILRFRCVSRSWHYLLSFSSGLTHNLLPLTLSGFFYNYVNHVRKVAFYFTIKFTGLGPRTYADVSPMDVTTAFLPPLSQTECCHQRRLIFLHSCGGLVLLRNEQRNEECLIVCNPATRRWAKIPYPPSKLMAFALAFDPHRSRCYKVISFPCPYSLYSMFSRDTETIEVFSSETGKWTEKHVTLRGTNISDTRCSLDAINIIFVNGLLYIMDFKGHTFAVNLDKNAFWIVTHPENLPLPNKELRYNQCIGQSQGLLHYATTTRNAEVMVWVIEDPESNQYVLKHRQKLHGWKA